MSTCSPIVSVIVSANELAEYLPQTLTSVLRQTYKDFEVLIFSNRRLTGVEYWSLLQDRRLKFAVQENLSTFEIFNLGITKARGKYITFINIRDRWHPDKLIKQIACLEQNPQVGLVHSWGMRLPPGQSKGKIVKYSLSGWIEPEILKRNQINSRSVMIRRHCFETVGLFNPNLATVQDWDMWIRLSRRYQVRSISEPLVCYPQYLDSIVESWLVIETNLQSAIETAYQSASGSLTKLKPRSYGYASLFLAWQVLQNQEPDLTIANHYCRQALEHSPRIGFSWDFLRCSLTMLLLRFKKSDHYGRLAQLLRIIHKKSLKAAQKIKFLIYSLLHWMLEEDEHLTVRKGRGVKHRSRD